MFCVCFVCKLDFYGEKVSYQGYYADLHEIAFDPY